MIILINADSYRSCTEKEVFDTTTAITTGIKWFFK